MFWKTTLTALLGALSLLTPPTVPAQEVEMVFEGFPTVRVSAGPEEQVAEELEPDEASEYRVVISRIGDDYFWASRDNVPMVRRSSGSYVTFVAVTGAGYVRVVADSFGRTAEGHAYMEHLTLALQGYTYWGLEVASAEGYR